MGEGVRIEFGHAFLAEVYRRLLLVRRFEEQVSEFVEHGQISGAAHLSIGQEAAIVGACMALRPDDYMVGTHRSHGHPLAKGSPPAALMAELFGRRTGVNKGKGGSMHLADFKVGSLGETSIVGAGLPIAVGGALSAQIRGTDQVALAFFGDGAANQGAFHEALNLAAIWRLPAIFYCENNLYAMTTPVAYATSVPDIADRGCAYGIPGEVVDGQDVLACYRATERAVARARAGQGPSLIEAKTYRFVEHAAGLRVTPYRPETEMAAWRERDPIPAFRATLREAGLGELEVAAIEAGVTEAVAAAVDFAAASPDPGLEEMFEDVYAVTVGPTR